MMGGGLRQCGKRVSGLCVMVFEQVHVGGRVKLN